MALSNLFGWKKKAETEVQCSMRKQRVEHLTRPEEKPAACGTACGASDK